MRKVYYVNVKVLHVNGKKGMIKLQGIVANSKGQAESVAMAKVRNQASYLSVSEILKATAYINNKYEY